MDEITKAQLIEALSAIRGVLTEVVKGLTEVADKIKEATDKLEQMDK